MDAFIIIANIVLLIVALSVLGLAVLRKKEGHHAE